MDPQIPLDTIYRLIRMKEKNKNAIDNRYDFHPRAKL
jgi:hypothetical protein